MKGLTTNFELSQGRFSLVEGSDKAKDCIWFFCIFDRFRVYCSDFGGNFVSLVQKPASSLLISRAIILNTLRKGILKYVGSISVKTIDIGYLASDRTNFHIAVEYIYKDDTNEIQGVTFV